MTKLRIILAGVVCGYLCASVLLWVLRAATTTIPGPLTRSSQSASPMPTHDFESYADAVGLNALNGGSDFAGAYVDRGGITGLQQFDTFESYTDGASLNALNAGGWTGAYVDRINFTGLKALDDSESYTDAASLNGLNGGTGWGGAFVDR